MFMIRSSRIFTKLCQSFQNDYLKGADICRKREIFFHGEKQIDRVLVGKNLLVSFFIKVLHREYNPLILLRITPQRNAALFSFLSFLKDFISHFVSSALIVITVQAFQNFRKVDTESAKFTLSGIKFMFWRNLHGYLALEFRRGKNFMAFRSRFSGVS